MCTRASSLPVLSDLLPLVDGGMRLIGRRARVHKPPQHSCEMCTDVFLGTLLPLERVQCCEDVLDSQMCYRQCARCTSVTLPT